MRKAPARSRSSRPYPFSGRYLKTSTASRLQGLTLDTGFLPEDDLPDAPAKRVFFASSRRSISAANAISFWGFCSVAACSQSSSQRSFACPNIRHQLLNGRDANRIRYITNAKPTKDEIGEKSSWKLIQAHQPQTGSSRLERDPDKGSQSLRPRFFKRAWPRAFPSKGGAGRLSSSIFLRWASSFCFAV